MEQTIEVGLCAYGMSGELFHAPFIATNPKFKLKKVLERHRNDAQMRYPSIETVRSYDELLDDQDIELIIVNTPDHTHFDLASRALQAGKHVVVEKPFVVNSTDGDALIALATKQNRLLSVFQNRRWDGDFLTVSKIVEHGLLGRLVEFEVHYDRYRNFIQQSWKEVSGVGTGTLYNLGTHLIDQIVQLFGNPEWIVADLAILRSGGQVDDFFEVQLGYPNLKAVAKTSYLVREPGPRYMLHGTEGSFVKYGIDPQEENLKMGMLPDSPNWGREPESQSGKLNTTINGLHFSGTIESFAGSYHHFYNNIFSAIRQGAPLAVTAQQANNIIKIIEAAITSHREHRTVFLDF